MRKSEALFDQVILATPAPEAARLAQALAPAWSASAAAMAHEPIVTIALAAPRRAWPAPMLALDSDDTTAPAQFAFKLAPQPPDVDRVTLVVSAAGRWLERGSDGVAAAAIAQYRRTFAIRADETVALASVRADKRATFRCTAGVVRPAMDILPGLRAAADYVAGPYPATLEAAVIAGEAAALALQAEAPFGKSQREPGFHHARMESPQPQADPMSKSDGSGPHDPGARTRLCAARRAGRAHRSRCR